MKIDDVCVALPGAAAADVDDDDDKEEEGVGVEEEEEAVLPAPSIGLGEGALEACAKVLERLLVAEPEDEDDDEDEEELPYETPIASEVASITLIPSRFFDGETNLATPPMSCTGGYAVTIGLWANEGTP